MYIPTSVLVPGVLTSANYTLGGDVAMTNGDGTFYDGPSGSFAEGTWLIVWHITVSSPSVSANDITIQLCDSAAATFYDEVQHDFTPVQAVTYLPYSGCAIVSLAVTTTLKLRVMSFRSGYTIRRDITYQTAASHTASRVCGIQVS